MYKNEAFDKLTSELGRNYLSVLSNQFFKPQSVYDSKDKVDRENDKILDEINGSMQTTKEQELVSLLELIAILYDANFCS